MFIYEKPDSLNIRFSGHKDPSVIIKKGQIIIVRDGGDLSVNFSGDDFKAVTPEFSKDTHQYTISVQADDTRLATVPITIAIDGAEGKQVYITGYKPITETWEPLVTQYTNPVTLDVGADDEMGDATTALRIVVDGIEYTFNVNVEQKPVGDLLMTVTCQDGEVQPFDKDVFEYDVIIPVEYRMLNVNLHYDVAQGSPLVTIYKFSSQLNDWEEHGSVSPADMGREGDVSFLGNHTAPDQYLKIKFETQGAAYIYNAVYVD